MSGKTVFAAAALTLAVLAPAAHAQGQEAGTASAQQGTQANPDSLTPEERANFQRAARIVRVFSGAISSEAVQNPVKGRLLVCMYNNKMSDIAAATGRVLESNPNLDPAEPRDFYRAAAGVCGVMFKRVAPADGGEGGQDTQDAPQGSASGENTGR